MNDEPILTHAQMKEQVQKVADKFLEGGPLPFSYHPTGHERVKATVEDMEPIPAGANPFVHDDYSMGTDLVRGWTVMHPGFDNKEEPRALQWLYLVNTRTGQRIKIKLDHVGSIEQVAVQVDKWRTDNGITSDEVHTEDTTVEDSVQTEIDDEPLKLSGRMVEVESCLDHGLVCSECKNTYSACTCL